MTMRNRVRTTVLASLVLLCVAPRSAAAQDAKAALAQLKQAEGTALSAAKIQIKAARQVVLLAIKTFEDAVKAGGFANGVVSTLVTSLVTYQEAVRAAVDNAGIGQGNAAHNALAALPGPLNGHYPRGFSPGDGGLSDAFRVKLEALLDGSTRTVVKRLVKTTTVAEVAGVGLTFRVRSPSVYLDRRWSESTGGFYTNVAPVIDVVVGISQLAVEADGQLRVAGTADNGANVMLAASGPEIDSASVAVVSRRWQTILNGGGTGLGEGNYTLRAQSGTDGNGGTAHIGIR